MQTNLKRQHETAVGNRLIRSLSLPATFLRGGNDRDEPDVIYSWEGALLGIEVVTAYYDDPYAKDVWDLALGKTHIPTGGMLCLGSGVVTVEKMFARIQHEINEKCLRTYRNVDRTWLCVAHQGPEETHVIADYVERLVVPAKHGFERIFIDYQAPINEDDGGGWRSVELGVVV